MIGRGALLALGCLLLAAAPALAYEPALETELAESPQHFTAGLRIGALFMSTDEFEQIYGKEPLTAYGLNLGYKLVHHLELVGEALYTTDRGPGVDSEGNETGEDYRIHFAPASLGLLYRLDFAHEQVVVPYLGGGADGAYFYEERVRGGDKTTGMVYGWHGTLGVQFLLDPLERRAANNLEDDWNINDVYLVIEGRYLALDDFGKNSGDNEGIDLSGWFAGGGLLFQF